MKDLDTQPLQLWLQDEAKIIYVWHPKSSRSSILEGALLGTENWSGKTPKGETFNAASFVFRLTKGMEVLTFRCVEHEDCRANSNLGSFCLRASGVDRKKVEAKPDDLVMLYKYSQLQSLTSLLVPPPPPTPFPFRVRILFDGEVPLSTDGRTIHIFRIQRLDSMLRTVREQP